MEPIKKLGLFGGTFNPPHLGHLKLAQSFADKLGLSEVRIIPSYVPPHKQAIDLASGNDRLEMCRLTFSGDSRFRVSDMEIKRGGKSYTYDTLTAIKKEEPNTDIYMFVGSDMLNSFDKWYRYEDILKLCTLCACVRSKDDVLSGKFGYIKIDFEPIDISSTEIRRMIKEGDGAENYLAPEVSNYIRERRLYIEG